MYITENAERIFSWLKEEYYLIGVDKANIYDKLAYYLGRLPSPLQKKNRKIL